MKEKSETNTINYSILKKTGAIWNLALDRSSSVDLTPISIIWLLLFLSGLGILYLGLVHPDVIVVWSGGLYELIERVR